MARITGKNDALVNAQRFLEKAGKRSDFEKIGVFEGQFDDIRMHEKTRRPWGGENFVSKLESKLLRSLAPQKPGPKAGRNNEN